MLIRNSEGELLDHTFHHTERKDVLVVFGHGLTGDKDRPLMVALAEGLAQTGWPSVRFSFSGNGASEGKFLKSCITKQLGDLSSLLDVVKGVRKIIYIGHSMGAAVGVLTAAMEDRVNLVVSLAGMVRTKDFCEAEFADQVPDEGCMWEDENFPLSQVFVDDLNSIETTLTAAKNIRTPQLIMPN